MDVLEVWDYQDTLFLGLRVPYDNFAVTLFLLLLQSPIHLQ